MGFTKHAAFEAQVLGVKGSSTQRTASLDKLADFEDYRTEQGYLYARIRAISSRVNKNDDGWPSIELAGSPEIFDQHTASTGFTVEAKRGAEYGFSTFVGKPIFIDHHNSDPSKARGVIRDAKFHVDDHKTASLDPYYSSPDVDPEHLPPSWVELLLEVDAKQFPKLAKAIIEGSRNPNKGIDGFSMGCDVERSVCSICKNSATAPDEFCNHIKLKGMEHKAADGKTRRSYENCYGVKFFEISAVFDPADETALLREVRSSTRTADNPIPQADQAHAPNPINTLREEKICPVCGSTQDEETCEVCFTPETLVRTADGYVPICEIQPGDQVLSEDGRFHRVLEVFERDYHGILNEIQTHSMLEPVRVTPNHPFKSLVGYHISKDDQCSPGRCNKRISHPRTKTRHELEWVEANQVRAKDHLLTNVPQEFIDRERIDIPEQFRGKRYTSTSKHGPPNEYIRKGPVSFDLTPEFLWAMGLYIAEGSGGDRCINYALHRDEVEYQQRLIDLFQSYGYNAKLTLRADKPNSAWVDISSSTLAEWLPYWLGSGSANKRIPSELLNLPDEKVAHILRGVLDGDGTNAREQLGQTSPVLALQMMELAMRRGGEPTVQVERPSAKKSVYTINGTTVTTTRRAKGATKKYTWRIGDNLLSRVKTASLTPYCGRVYNLRVEDDPTYTVQNILVHNCGYTEPPEPFQNPDLEKAQETDLRMDQAQEQGQDGIDVGSQDQPQVEPKVENSPRNSGVVSHVTDDMAWDVSLHPHLAGRINTSETPVLPGGPATDEPKETIIKDQSQPVTSSVRTAADFIAAAGRNKETTMSDTTRVAAEPIPGAGNESGSTRDHDETRVDVTGVGGVMHGTNEEASKADSQVDVLGIGGTGEEGVKADKTVEVEQGNEHSKNIEAIPTKTFPDEGQHDPITSEPFPASEDGVKQGGWIVRALDSGPYPQHEDSAAGSGGAVEGTQPSDPIGKPDERVNLLDPTTSPANNSGPTKTWSGTDGNGVTKQQDPVTNESIALGESGMHNSHVFTAFKLARLEVELGMIDKDQEFTRAAALEQESPAVLHASLAYAERVRTAARKRTAATRLPVLGRNASTKPEPTPAEAESIDPDFALGA